WPPSSSLFPYTTLFRSKMIGTATNYLLCRNGFMTGTSTNPITVDSVYIGSTSFLNYSGGITAKKVTLSSANIGANMAVTAEEKRSEEHTSELQSRENLV